MIAEANKTYETPIGMNIVGDFDASYEHILTPEALDFIMSLHERFDRKRMELLAKRIEKQIKIDCGDLPDFLPETSHVRASDWTVQEVPDCLMDRQIEFSCHPEKKVIANALNAGANVFVADMEDGTSPSWDNMMRGQVNLNDAILQNTNTSDDTDEKNKVSHRTPVLFLQPRGLHMLEKHIIVHGQPMSGSLVDFGLYFFHNAHELIRQGYGPFFYLTKLESHQEARLWNEIFKHAQSYLGIAPGTIKATVIVETLTASFELNEILHELRDHASGMSFDPRDFHFSYIKKLRNHKRLLLPNRDQLSMAIPTIRELTDLLIHTCHKRGVHAIGHLSAPHPIDDESASNKATIEKVMLSLEQRFADCFDGISTNNYELINTVKTACNKPLATPHQIHEKRLDVQPNAASFLKAPTGTVTEEGLRDNIRTAITCIESWINNKESDESTEEIAIAELSRSQLWQWLKHPTELPDGRVVTAAMYEKCKGEELVKMELDLGDETYTSGRYKEAARLLDELVLKDTLEDFLTLPVYNFID